MLSTEITRLNSLSRSQRQQLDDLYRLLLLRLKSLQICLQQHPQHLTHIQSMKHLLDQIEILQNQNEQIQGQKLILEQIRVEQSQVREQRIVEYEAMIEEVRSLLQTKEDNIKRLTTARGKMHNVENAGEMLYGELTQTVAMGKMVREQYARLRQTAERVRYYKEELGRTVERIRAQVVGKSDAYQKFVREGKIDLPRYDMSKMEATGYEDLKNQFVNVCKPQLWFSSRLYQVRGENIKLMKKLKEQMDLTTFMAKDYETLVKKYRDLEPDTDLRYVDQKVADKKKDIKNKLRYKLEDWESVKSA